jgi:hypothetical protein
LPGGAGLLLFPEKIGDANAQQSDEQKQEFHFFGFGSLLPLIIFWRQPTGHFQ